MRKTCRRGSFFKKSVKNVSTAGYIADNIKQRQCSTYIESEERRDHCQCGRDVDWHVEQNIDVTATRDDGPSWNTRDHTVQEPCDSFGHIHFRGYGSQTSVSPYVRVDCDTDMQKIWTILTGERCWQLPLPRLLISVTGGAKKYNMQPRLIALLKQGLVNAAVSTRAWIITGGTATGVMKLVGEAVQDYTQATGNPEDNEIVALGIAAWGFVANNQALQGVMDDIEPVDYSPEEDSKDLKSCAPLDHGHTHFLLVDDGTEGKLGADIAFRSELERYISTMQRNKRDSGSQAAMKVPCVLIVVEGGVNTLQTAWESIKRDCPVVVIAGSGRAADFITAAFGITKPEGEGALFPPGFEETMMRKAKELLVEDHTTATEAVKRVRDCLNKRNLLHIFDPDKVDSVKDIETTILYALMNVGGTDTSFIVDSQLSLALAWNRCDIARKHIFIPDKRRYWQKADLHTAMFTALVEDQCDFVQLFLDYGLVLKQFLSLRKLWELYNNSMAREEMAELLKFGTKPTRFQEQPDLKDDPDLLPFISKVVVRLLQEKCFLFYSDEHRVETEQDVPVNNIQDESHPAGNEKRETQPSGTEKRKPDLDHPERELFLWSLLFNRQELALLFWKTGLDHIGGALFASALMKMLSEWAQRTEMAELSDDLEKHSNDWEQRAVSLLSECYSSDPEMTSRLLVRELRHWGPLTKSRWSTLLYMAHSYKLMDFAGHVACQTKLSSIWKGRIAVYTSEWRILFSILFPVVLLFIRFSSENSKKDQDGEKRHRKSDKRVQKPEVTYNSPRMKQRSQSAEATSRPVTLFCRNGNRVPFVRAVQYFYTAPVTKFFCTILSYVVYLGLFSYFMLVELDERSMTPAEILTIVWQFTMYIEQARRCVELMSRNDNWLSSCFHFWTHIEQLTTFLFALTTILRLALLHRDFMDFRVIRSFFSVILVLSYLRSMQFFFAARTIGPKVIMIQKMVTDVLLFFAILLVFVLGFGVAYHANMFPKAALDWSILVHVFYFPYFQIYGELLINYLKGGEEEWCEKNETVWRLTEDPYTRCPERSPVLYVLLAVYMILTNILLVNLLIAIFSYTFGEVQENSLKVWRFYRLSLVHEYYACPALVRPFNILYYFSCIPVRAFHNIRHRCCPGKKLSKRLNSFNLELDMGENRQLTLFEKCATEKYLLLSNTPSDVSSEHRSEAVEADLKTVVDRTETLKEDVMLMKDYMKIIRDDMKMVKNLKDDVKMIKDLKDDVKVTKELKEDMKILKASLQQLHRAVSSVKKD